MDLIYMNQQKEDIGVLLEYDFDLACGTDENNFECVVSTKNHCCAAGYYLYIEDTDYGGIIDSIQNDTEKGEITYSGRTWQGILNSKVIQPDTGNAYLILSGDANTVLGTLISRLTLANLFSASPDSSGLTIKNYKMDRYICGYDGIRKMLNSVGAKLLFTFSGGKVILSAVKKHDYTNDEEFDSDQVSFRVSRKYHTVNHLVCLGTGELENRMVVHLYADSSGNISQTKTEFGTNEYAATYDYSSVESLEELISSGTERLKELWEQNKLSISLDNLTNEYDIGDIVGAYDNVTNVSVVAEVTKKIVTIKNGQITISYEVGG